MTALVADRRMGSGQPDVLRVNEVLERRPAVGLGLGLVRNRRFEFQGRGLADIASSSPITEDTVFPIGSVTKTFTAIAVMQLWELGLVDLDRPASDYLRAYTLIPARSTFRPVTLRHLLTHTAGIPDVRGISDLLHASLTPSGGRPALLSVDPEERLPSLAEYYRGGLRVVAEPGSAFAYSNHGYATLGQIVEDVSGLPFARYVRKRIFEPLGMAHSSFARSDRIGQPLATGYTLGHRGATAVPDRDWIGAGADGIYSTACDMGRFASALLGGGANDHGRVLEPTTLAKMFEPHYQQDTRLPGMGLGFFRASAAGHGYVLHDGILPGFNTELLVAPEDGIGLIGFTNGSRGAFGWLPLELRAVLREVLGLPTDARRRRVTRNAAHPEVWAQLLGRYVLPPRIADLRERLALGGGAHVFVGDGQLMVRLLAPVPTLLRGLPFEPGDATDPYVFYLDLAPFGMSPVRVVFADVVDGRATTIHTDLGGQPWSLVRSADHSRRKLLATALASLAIALSVKTLWRSRPFARWFRTSVVTGDQ